MRTIILLAILVGGFSICATAQQSLSMLSFRESIEASPAEKRKEVMQANLKALTQKIKELDKPDFFDMERVDLITLKSLYEPLVELAERAPDNKKCALTTHELELYTNGDGESSEDVEEGKAIIALFCPKTE